jgi:N-acetylglutamate synthase-like GNAT family acetyltransferase
MDFRSGRPEDFDQCASLLEDAWDSPRQRARLGYLLMSRSAIVGVDQRTVGAFALLENDFFCGNTMYIRTAVVRKDLRNAGAGTALLEACVNAAKIREMRRVFVDTYAPSEAVSAKILRKSGFEVVGDVENLHDEGGTYRIYSLPINVT